MTNRRKQIEKTLQTHIVDELSKSGYPYSLDNFLVDTDNKYQGAILDFSVRYESDTKVLGSSGWCGYVNYAVSLQVPLSATNKEESRDEARQIEAALMRAIIRASNCAPIKAVSNVVFLKAVVQDQYRSLQNDGALMLEIGTFFELQYVEDFYE